MNSKMMEETVKSTEYPVFESETGAIFTWCILNLENGGVVTGPPSVKPGRESYSVDFEQAVARAKAYEELRPLIEHQEADRIMHSKDKMPEEDAKAYTNPDHEKEKPCPDCGEIHYRPDIDELNKMFNNLVFVRRN